MTIEPGGETGVLFGDVTGDVSLEAASGTFLQTNRAEHELALALPPCTAQPERLPYVVPLFRPCSPSILRPRCDQCFVLGWPDLVGRTRSQAFKRDRLRAMDAAIETAVTEGRLPGGVLWLEQEGQVYRKAYGARAIEPGGRRPGSTRCTMPPH